MKRSSVLTPIVTALLFALLFTLVSSSALIERTESPDIPCQVSLAKAPAPPSTLPTLDEAASSRRDEETAVPVTTTTSRPLCAPRVFLLVCDANGRILRKASYVRCFYEVFRVETAAG